MKRKRSKKAGAFARKHAGRMGEKAIRVLSSRPVAWWETEDSLDRQAGRAARSAASWAVRALAVEPITPAA